MAKLTDTLQSEDSGKRIIAPAQPYSFLSTLSDAVGQGASAWAKGDAKRKADAQTRTGNELAIGVQGLRSTAEDSLRAQSVLQPINVTPAVGDSSSNIPSDMAAQMLELSKTRQAADQGRATQDALDLKMERFVTDMMTKHPENAGYISSVMQQNGFDHYMFRSQEYQSKTEDAVATAKDAGRAEAVKLATDVGHTGSDEYLYQKGTEIKQQQMLNAQMHAAAEEARAASAENRSAADWLRARASETAQTLYTSKMSSDLGTITDQVNQAILGAGSDAESFTHLQNVDRLTTQFGASYIVHLQNDMTTNKVKPEDQKIILDDAQHKIEALHGLLSGPTSRLQQNMQTFQYLQNTYNLQAGQALPFYNFLKTTFGSDAALGAVFGVGQPPALSKELQDKVAGEIKNFDPTKPNTGFHILTEIGALASGDKSLTDLPESQITGDHIRGIAAGIQANAKAILDPEPDNPAEYKGFLGSYGNMVIASNSIQPGYKDVNGWAFAIENLTSQNGTTVLDSAMHNGQFKGQALSTFQAGRSAVGRLLEVGRTVVQAPTGQGIKVSNGQFVAFNNNRTAKQQYWGDTAMDGLAFNGSEGGPVKPSAQVQRQASLMNRAVDYLVHTAQADPSLKGVSEKDLRSHYLSGTPLPTKEGDTPAKATPDWETAVSALERSLSDKINSMPKDKPLGVPMTFKDGRDAAIRTMIGEAGAEGPKGLAAVGAVIRNRAQQSGMDPTQVVTAPGQFEPWSTRSSELMNISEEDPRYVAAAKAWDSGEDPTGGATHFYAPKLQAQLGRAKPAWDDGSGVDIGNHRFFKRGYKG